MARFTDPSKPRVFDETKRDVEPDSERTDGRLSSTRLTLKPKAPPAETAPARSRDITPHRDQKNPARPRRISQSLIDEDVARKALMTYYASIDEDAARKKLLGYYAALTENEQQISKNLLAYYATIGAQPARKLPPVRM